MANYICYLKSDIYKLCHSCFFLLHAIFAVCGAAMMLLLPRRKIGKKRMEEKTNNPRGIMLEPTHK